MSYYYDIIFRICFYTMLGMGANIVVGSCGLLLLCEGAILGIGAYTCALTMVELSVSFPIALLLSIFSSVVIALFVLNPLLRLRGDTFAIATLGIQMIIISIFNNWPNLTKGPYGLSGIPQPAIGPWEIDTKLEIMLLTMFFCLIVYALSKQLHSLPYGRSLQALRDDEIAATTLGKDVMYYYLIAVAVSAGIMGAAGAFYSVYAAYIEPMTFDLDESIKILSVIIIGGLGRESGALIGAIIIIVFPEILRILGLSQAGVAGMERIIYGIILLLILRFKPTGFWGRVNLR